MKAQHGCEILHWLDATFRPTGAKWLWLWEEQWSSLRHEQLETVLSLRGRMEELAAKMAECGLVITSPHITFKLLGLVCAGPYHDIFATIQQKICVLDNPDWTLPQLTVELVTDRLSSLLRRSDYYGANEQLKKGQYPSASGSSRITGVVMLVQAHLPATKIGWDNVNCPRHRPEQLSLPSSASFVARPITAI
jgi:hypothetical protein